MQKKLSRKELDNELRSLTHSWKFNIAHTSITLTFDHIGYIDALILVSKLIVYAEVHQQSPIITLNRDKIKISILALDKMGLTKEIFNFARLIDRLPLSTVTKRR
ncbi:hypothetical protein CO026_00830 [Candidatus Kaiserbacteria bacterium CG_4_9_14_0_2_um_filter_41_32]|uniref:4a-hydroxytetrahydrobiopterin dehydratase n=1 Tax=Candidatus Kaiserbacteria bacterium CG_4_9_14_0_2_um_filter_41_32 TaxID=1974601 RepID=A0A2M8FFE3_9BACT|nr:MAG: hypothetical protein CO026_00830 [Candidatus Kaiserbacteria bacterium CG_4_9_14_0_2_um_filter_41_32]